MLQGAREVLEMMETGGVDWNWKKSGILHNGDRGSRRMGMRGGIESNGCSSPSSLNHIFCMKSWRIRMERNEYEEDQEEPPPLSGECNRK